MNRLLKIAAAAALAALAMPALAQDKAPAKDAPKPAAQAPAAKPAAKPAAPAAKPADKPAAAAPGGMEMPPEALAAMTPGEMHAKLKPMEGKWTFQIKMWMAPDAPPMDATGTASFKMIFGGRYMQADIESPNGPMGPFAGMGVMGYDNVKKQYHSTWYDSSGTAPMVMTGQLDAAGKVLAWKGENYDIFEGRMVKARSEMTMPDANTIKETMYALDAAGKEFKVMELHYTRAK